MRLHTEDSTGEPYHWDGITIRPFRPCIVSPSLYVPSPTFQSNCIRVYDFDTITPKGPLLLEIPCEVMYMDAAIRTNYIHLLYLVVETQQIII